MTPFLADPDFVLYVGDALETLRQLEAESVDCALTSPPFYGLRDYGTGAWEGGNPDCDHLNHPGIATGNKGAVTSTPMRNSCGKCGARRVDQQIGLEATPDQWCDRLVQVFREVRRVLKPAGTLWVECGDSYAAGKSGRADFDSLPRPKGGHREGADPGYFAQRSAPPGYKPKDLLGSPWALAKALRDPYYTGDIKSERDRIWLAATIDAEGSICGHRHTRKDDGSVRTGLHCTITNTSEAMLDEAQRIWPASRQQHDGRDGSFGERACWRWVATNVDRCSALMRELYPYFLVKRQQALLAFNFYEMSAQSKRYGQTKVGEEMRGKRDWIVGALSDLNHGRPVDLPKWIVEPTSLFEPGFYLRQCIVWSKSNPMPESVTDRCTTSHSYVFLLSKSPRYYFDAEAISELSVIGPGAVRNITPGNKGADGSRNDGDRFGVVNNGSRNARSVWAIATEGYPEAHFATFPQALVEPCIKAGCPEWVCGTCGKPRERLTDVEYEEAGKNNNSLKTKAGGNAAAAMSARPYETRMLKHVTTTGWSDCGHNNYQPGTILDPFLGSGTTAQVARRLGRRCVGIELNPEYAQLAARRLQQQSLFA